ncbi:MAG TPA: alpha-L-rhamnosidase C-terminal domain-containing protein [Terracidiphilus sp.]|nr:alpha-L-rhamnosidase C-terminal domain-containing protein [Terracidiphilus sp.]
MDSKQTWKNRGREVTRRAATLLALALALAVNLGAQSIAAGSLDPARYAAVLHRPTHTLLAEQYIWTANDAAALRPDHAKFTYRERERKTEPHAFRGSFILGTLPSVASLYLVGPRSAKAFLNGKLVMDQAADAASPLNTHVFRADISSALRIGQNVLAIEAVRGRGIVAASTVPEVQQLAYGEVLVVKVVPAGLGVDAVPLAHSNSTWRGVAAAPQGWQAPGFDDRAWPHVQSLGPIESRAEFFQWNIDAGMYDWPGYLGMSPYLRTYTLLAANVTHRTEGTGGLAHVEALTDSSSREWFTVRLPAAKTELQNAPGLLLDFGREVTGRLLIESACDCEAQVQVSYGESESEALSGEHYLGSFLMRVPPRGTVRGPKSGFRYALLRFAGGAPETAFRSIRMEGIAYPVDYKGSFESSDPLLNQIWETAVYTAHLCMQDGIWDAPKRDRGWWAGDLDVSGPVIGDVFADRFLLEQTLTSLIPPGNQNVNDIPGYTALWIDTLADLYRHSGDKTELEQKYAVLLKLLARIDAELDSSGRFLNKDHLWLFVDWSPGLFAFTDEAREGTALEFVRAYRKGAWLLNELGAAAEAKHYQTRADELSVQMRSQFASANGVFGDRLQLNSMAVIAGVAEERNYPAIWEQSLSTVMQQGPQAQTISPFFSAYLLQAMARMGHRREALDLMRNYWGGMLAEGATSFWEAYDRRWPKTDPHRSLQADGVTGHFVSLAHGWSSGPAAWLMEQVLGIQAAAPGFRKAIVRPDLLGLDWAKGQVPTPHGPIGVEIRRAPEPAIDLSLPTGVEATVLVPCARPCTQPGAAVLVNGERVASSSAENGARAAIVLRSPGHYKITSR